MDVYAMAMHPSLWGRFITNTYVRDLVHAGIAKAGATGGEFTLPGYPASRVFTDYALMSTHTGLKGPLIGDSGAPAAVLRLGPVKATQYRDKKQSTTSKSSDNTWSQSLS